MITVYVTTSCKSCKKAIEFLKENNISYIEKNLFFSVLDINELKKMLKYTEDGFDSIISKRSNVYEEIDFDFNDLTMNEASDFIIKNPSILKRPIIIDDERGNMEIGYNVDGIRIFLPSKKEFSINTDRVTNIDNDVEVAKEIYELSKKQKDCDDEDGDC
ncbi:MAG: Spx/MgsR family RNA polymerase-binding regulatory protein [Mycoplasma sp.]|nr:Spx/MgsR family RNA polymerase-binding regulatory protein [Mycoplasma sp.]